MEDASFGSPLRNRWLHLAGLSLLLAAAAMTIDVWVSRYVHEHSLPKELLRILNFAEVFGHAYGVIAILATAYLILAEHRRAVWRAIGHVAAVGVGVDVLKLFVMRIRPHHFDLTQNVQASFIGFFQFAAPDGYLRFTDARIHSFPSGHSAMAVALAISMTQLEPRGKWLFVLFAGLAMGQRIAVTAHFPSDTLAGAAFAFVVAATFWKKSS